jgi:hypothetical protein
MRHLNTFDAFFTTQTSLPTDLFTFTRKDPKRSKKIEAHRHVDHFQVNSSQILTGRARTAAAVPSEVVTRRRAQGKIAEATWQWRGENCRENMRKPWAVMSICCLKTHAKTDHVGDLK